MNSAEFLTMDASEVAMCNEGERRARHKIIKKVPLAYRSSSLRIRIDIRILIAMHAYAARYATMSSRLASAWRRRRCALDLREELQLELAGAQSSRDSSHAVGQLGDSLLQIGM